jgi:putative membrane protein
MMWLDALLAYLHYTAIFLLFAFMTVEVMLMRGALDAPAIRLLGRVDLWYFGSAIAALVTGFLRLAFGAKGAEFYLSGWPIYVKLALFFAVAIVSIQPTMTFIRWRKHLEADPAWKLDEGERARMRRYLMIEVHLAALIPLVAVIMARGLVVAWIHR